MQSSYKLATVSRACALLRQFSDERQMLTLSEIVKGTGIERTICFRLLRSLEDEGLLRRVEGRRYASNLRIFNGRRFRIGYALEGVDTFSGAVGQGLRRAADAHQVDLIEMNNRYSSQTALRNAKMLIRQKVDLAIEFQVYEQIAAQISGLFKEADIPVIALDIPQPNAAYFGLDNHQVGLVAGKALLRAAQAEWSGKCDELLLLDLEIAGSLPHTRISGARTLLEKYLGGNWITTYLDSRGEYVRAFELTRKHLQSAPEGRTLLTGINDYAVLGALRAFEEAGRSRLCQAVSLGGVQEARRELRLPGTRLIGSVAFFPERYGQSVIMLALDILRKKAVAPAVYTPVQLLTAKNVNQYYPKDKIAPAETSPAMR